MDEDNAEPKVKNAQVINTGKASAAARKARQGVSISELDRQKEVNLGLASLQA